jgi:uncharacterized FlgJ-related protein
MNLYVYNKQSLTFKKVSIKQYLYLILIIGFIFSGLGFTGAIKFNQLVEKIPVVIRLQEDEFSEENLKKEINNLGFKYPDIIYAQAVEETGRFKSPVFKQNNNLFGLKIPNLRPTLAIGENLNHAKFKNWRESLIERAMWDIQNTNNIYSKQEYYQLLDAIYAEKPGYSDRLKNIK